MKEEEENQPQSSAQKRLEVLEKKKRELERRIKEEQRLIKKAERDRHTLRLISMGILVASEIKAGTRSESDVREKLDKILIQDSHRLAWGLEPLPKEDLQQGKNQKPGLKASSQQKKSDVNKAASTEVNNKSKVEPKSKLREVSVKSIEDEFEDFTK